MSFRLFVYYCALCGGCAAYVGWALGRFVAGGGLVDAAVKGLFLGLVVALVLGLVDSLWTFAPGQVGRYAPRVLLALVGGALGGLLGGLIGQLFLGWSRAPALVVLGWLLGWTITGLLVGSSLGVYDMLARLVRGEDLRGAGRKVRNGLLGGALGGFLGAALFLLLKAAWGRLFREELADQLWSPSATGFVVLGLCIGLLIGLAQVLLKVAWVRVEAGFRRGRELILAKPEVTIGRAESCDIGLFGDPGVEKLHARISQRGGEYYLADADSPGGTFVNGQRVDGPVRLRPGDLIQLGKSALRFRAIEKRKR
jgi:hypothetical protein